MASRCRPACVAVTVLLAGCGGDASEEDAPSEEPINQSQAEPSAEPPKETLIGGLIAVLPQFGTLTWRCEGDRFAVRLQRPKPISTIDVTVSTDGERVVAEKPVNRAYETPLADAESQTWRMRWHHVPAQKRATVRLRFANSTHGDCFVRSASTSVRTDPSN